MSKNIYVVQKYATQIIAVINIIVSELISKLQKCNPNANVQMDIDWTTAEIFGIYEYPDGVLLSLGDYGTENLVG